MRPAIMPISSFHSAKSSGRPTTMDAMRARALRAPTPCQAQLCEEGACADLQGCQSKVSASLSGICILHTSQSTVYCKLLAALLTCPDAR